MVNSFAKAARRPVTSVKAFLKDSAESTIKYTAEANKKHLVYIPHKLQPVHHEDGTETEEDQIVAIWGKVHEMAPQAGKYEATMCLKDVLRTDSETGEVLNDGTCPYCERKDDAWAIRNWRVEQEEAACTKTGEDRESYMKATRSRFASERKVREVKEYLYLLLVKFKMQADDKTPVLGEDGLPEFELKVAKMSKGRIDKIQQTVENSGSVLEGSELIFSYPPETEMMRVVGQSTASPVFEKRMLTNQFPKLLDKINAEVAKFTWDGIEKAFKEWEGSTVTQATKKCNEMFHAWDEYIEKLKTDPNAKYLEYAGKGPEVENPELTSEVNASVPVLEAPSGLDMGMNIPNGEVFAGLGNPTM